MTELLSRAVGRRPSWAGRPLLVFAVEGTLADAFPVR
jgi:hypothetical protein